MKWVTRVLHPLFLAIVAASVVATTVIAGNLEPTAPPAPTMKSLDEIPGSWHRILDSTNGAPDGCNSDRFKCVMNNNEAVLDLETGLVWARTPRETNVSRGNEEECQPIGGRLGWRLPSAEEISTLIDPSKPFGQPRLPSGHPFVLTGSGQYRFWTSTPVFGSSDRFYLYKIDESNNNMDYAVLENGTSTAGGWCVRGPNSSNSPRRYN